MSTFLGNSKIANFPVQYRIPSLLNIARYLLQNAEILKKLYDSVDDIDLWIGGLLEDKAPGSLLGPVFTDIIAEQFSRLKRGDRYFFENEPSINPGYLSQGKHVNVIMYYLK